MKHFWLLLVVSILATFCTKRTEGDTFPKHVTLKITVKDETGALRPGTKVALYSDEGAYSTGLGNGNAGGQKVGITDANGVVTLDTVEANIEQWLLATYYDSVANILYSNRDLSSKINQLLPGSVIEMEVTIQPLSANIGFYTQSTVNLPIYVKMDGVFDSITTIASIPAALTPADTTEALIVPVSAGAHIYQAYTKTGCTWTGKIDIVNGEFITKGFDVCNLARVTFYFYDTAPVATVNFGPYEVLVDNVVVGQLNAIYAGGPPSSVCGLNDNLNAVTAYVEAGQTHTYQIRGSGSTCTWIDVINPLIPGQCFEKGIQATNSGNSCP